MSQVNVSHFTFDNDNTIYNLEDETARAEIEALHVELTQAEYDALTPEEKNNGTEYFITDSTDSGDFSYLENRLSVLDGKSNTLNEIATLEVTDVKGVIHSSASPKYTFIKNKGENDCYISATDDVGEGVDGTVLLQSNSTIMLESLSDVNYICNSEKTTVICVCFQNSVNDPFARDESISSSGGDGGGTLGIEEVVLWENEGTTNPKTITLSEAYTNFDELVFECRHKTKSQLLSSFYLTNDISTNVQLYPMYGSESHYIQYSFVNSTTLNNVDESGNFYFTKIVGRRYTRVNPSGYRRVTLWENETETKYPTTISLSASIYDFDDFSIEYEAITNGITYHFSTSALLQLYSIGDAFQTMFVDNANWANYLIASATSITLSTSAGSTYKIAKIIGIKY